MNRPLTIADTIAELAFANRCPCWREYERAAPCEQRAMIRRWDEILRAPMTKEICDMRDEAEKNWNRAMFGEPKEITHDEPSGLADGGPLTSTDWGV